MRGEGANGRDGTRSAQRSGRARVRCARARARWPDGRDAEAARRRLTFEQLARADARGVEPLRAPQPQSHTAAVVDSPRCHVPLATEPRRGTTLFHGIPVHTPPLHSPIASGVALVASEIALVHRRGARSSVASVGWVRALAPDSRLPRRRPRLTCAPRPPHPARRGRRPPSVFSPGPALRGKQPRRISLGDVDLLHPPSWARPQAQRLVRSPNSFFMDVKCPGCFNITTVFSHAQTVVLCGSCSTVLCQPTGGKARLTGDGFRRRLSSVAIKLCENLRPWAGFAPLMRDAGGDHFDRAGSAHGVRTTSM